MPPLPGNPITFTREALVELARPGESSMSGRGLMRLTAVGLALAIIVANVIGAAIVVVIAMFVIPLPEVADPDSARLRNGIVAAIYVLIAVPAGALAGYFRLRSVGEWLAEERAPTEAEQRVIFRAPLRLFVVQVVLWLLAALLFTILNLGESGFLARRVGTTVSLTGITVSAVSYLLAERILRPVAVRAFAAGSPTKMRVPGVTGRTILAWAFATGTPILGVVAIGIEVLAGTTSTTEELSITMVVLGSVALIVGFLSVTVAARAIADPVDSVRRALREVQRGNFDVRVHPYDGTQIGQLQAGFNEMVEGLSERQRIREVFGTYVDQEVAEHILQNEAAVGGEQLEVTVMFVDVRDFTGFAERIPPAEVVATINRLFERAVPIIHERGGHVDKFVGDGLLAAFGVLRRRSDHPDRAVLAAFEIERAVAEEFGEDLRVGIGLNTGPVVAGSVGGAGRLEFSVIGDAVNVAARVEAATRQTGDTILITGSTLERLADHSHFEHRDGLVLKGKGDPVAVYAPTEARRAAALSEPLPSVR